MNYRITEAENGDKRFILEQRFDFKLKGAIERLELVYETHGKLNPLKDNAILIHHALSPSHHVHSHLNNSEKGWWEGMIGQGKTLDPDKYFIICINNIGSCYGSSSPTSINPTTSKPYRSDFPSITMEDIVNSQYLLLQALGIQQLYAILGNSMGAMLSLTWAINYPDMLKYLISVSSCYKAYPANIANRVVQREIIQLDPAWQQGYYDENPINGLKIARKLGHSTYRNPADLNKKFIENDKAFIDKPCDVENYLEYNAAKFAAYFDVNSYLYLLNAMDLYDVTRGYANPTEAFHKIKANVLIISVDSDILFTPPQQDELYQQLQLANVDSTFIRHHSPYGHDTFLVETDNMDRYFKDFLK